MINITTDMGSTDITIEGNGLFVVGDAGVIVCCLYDRLAELMGKRPADAFACTAIDLLEKRIEGKDVDGEPLKKDAEPETETHEEPKTGLDDDTQPPKLTPQEVRVILDAMFKKEDK